MVLDNLISIVVATNIDDMPDFHAKEWSKMFGTSMFDAQPDDKIKEIAQRPTAVIRPDIEDNAPDEEEAMM